MASLFLQAMAERDPHHACDALRDRPVQPPAIDRTPTGAFSHLSSVVPSKRIPPSTATGSYGPQRPFGTRHGRKVRTDFLVCDTGSPEDAACRRSAISRPFGTPLANHQVGGCAEEGGDGHVHHKMVDPCGQRQDVDRQMRSWDRSAGPSGDTRKASKLRFIYLSRGRCRRARWRSNWPPTRVAVFDQELLHAMSDDDGFASWPRRWTNVSERFEMFAGRPKWPRATISTDSHSSLPGAHAIFWVGVGLMLPRSIGFRAHIAADRRLATMTSASRRGGT